MTTFRPIRLALLHGLIALIGLLSVHAAAADRPLERVVMQLRWLHQFQFAGYYAAVAQGYYRQMGLDVVLVEGSPERQPIAQVLAGRAQYGVANSELLYARLRGEPLVALATIGQHSPSVLLTRADAGIRSPQDLVGKRVMLMGGHEDVDFIAMLRNEGVPLERVRFLPSSYNIQDLIDGRTDAFNAYLTNEPYVLRQRGIAGHVINPIAYGVDFYSDALFTTEAELRDHPERVRAFREATLAGWRYAMEHPEEIIELILTRYSTRKTREHLAFEAEALRRLILPDLVEVGHMNPGRWAGMAQVFLKQGLVDSDGRLEGFLYDPEHPIADRTLWIGLAIALAGSLATAILAAVLWRLNRRLRRESAERDRMETRLLASERELRGILDNMQDTYYRADNEGRLTYVTPSLRDNFGYAPEEVLGVRISDLYADPADRERLLQTLRERDGKVRDHEILMRGRRGETVWLSVNAQFTHDEAGNINGLEGTIRNIDEKKATEEFILRQAFYDPLTDLPNRRLLIERLHQELMRSRRHGLFGALIFIDLDNFKTINDSLGHPVGDRLLRQVAHRLNGLIRAEDTAARLGGDEFVLLLPNLGQAREEAVHGARVVADKVRGSLIQPHLIDGQQLHCTPSMGVALFPLHGDDSADELLKQADIAMYSVKREGRNAIQFYQPEMADTARERLLLEQALREALRREALELHLQPQMGADGRLLGAEVLLRWQDPERGAVSPAKFIPVAEESGLILPLGAWVLRASLALGSRLARELGDQAPPLIAINISPSQFHQPDFVESTRALFLETGADPHRFELELTEGIFISQQEAGIAKMRELRELGLRFSIDDFGTGYSSLSYLKRLPIDTLKIDRSFVRDIASDANDAAIADTIVAMARALGLHVIAEGVETEAQRDFLIQRGCRAFQGYLYARPMATEAFIAWRLKTPA